MNRCQSKTERGAVLLLVIFALAALLGVAALAIDIGMMEWARQRAQNVADAAALAGGQKMATVAGASDAATQVVGANNTGGGVFQGVGITVNPGNSVTVQGYVNAPLSFAPAVSYTPRSTDGIANTLSVPATATVTMQNVCNLPPGSAVAPFGLIGDDPTNTDPAVAVVSALLSGAKTLPPGVYQPASSQVTLKMNVWTSKTTLYQAGSFVPMLLSGSSTSYFDSIRMTTDQTLSVNQQLPNVDLYHDNVAGTRQYLAARLAPSNTAFSHAFATYDTWFNAGGQELPDGIHPTDHLLILPVIAQSVKNQLAPVTIIAFAAFWVDQPVLSGTTNNIALGRFIGLALPGGSGGACSGAGGKTLPHLSS